jgi:hypothetical protein
MKTLFIFVNTNEKTGNWYYEVQIYVELASLLLVAFFIFVFIAWKFIILNTSFETIY